MILNSVVFQAFTGNYSITFRREPLSKLDLNRILRFLFCFFFLIQRYGT